MGGCCCRSARRTALDGAPICYYHPQDLVENEPSPSPHGLPSVVPVLIVDPNSHASFPDAYQEPSQLSLREVSMHIHSTTGSTENNDNKNEYKQPTATLPAVDTGGGDRFEGSDMANGLKEIESKSVSDCVSNSPKVMEKLSNLDSSMILVTDEEDVCPTCLEEYDAENPRIITRCRHHFHLSCILEWFERSNTCAICDKIMEVDNIALFVQTL